MDDGCYFSGRLAEDYPDEILKIYWKEVNRLLCVSNNNNYSMAVGFLKKIKSIMKKNGRREEWEMKFRELKETHKRKKNFLAMLGKM